MKVTKYMRNWNSPEFHKNLYTNVSMSLDTRVILGQLNPLVELGSMTSMAALAIGTKPTVVLNVKYREFYVIMYVEHEKIVVEKHLFVNGTYSPTVYKMTRREARLTEDKFLDVAKVFLALLETPEGEWIMKGMPDDKQSFEKWKQSGMKLKAFKKRYTGMLKTSKFGI